MPALIWLYRDIVTDEPSGILRTYIERRADGTDDKLMGSDPKWSKGRAKGAVIKLSPDDQVTTGLGLCEGAETGLAILGTEWSPIWVTGGRGVLAAFPVLAGVEALTIFHRPR